MNKYKVSVFENGLYYERIVSANDVCQAASMSCVPLNAILKVELFGSTDEPDDMTC